MQKTAYLILENGMVFEGTHFGYEADAMGELVFTTAMAGYLETLTDPSYCGQIVMQTFPLIGNYGVIPEDFESEKPQVRAYVVRQWCENPSNFRTQEKLNKYLADNKIVAISGVDTRAITKIIREQGVMNALITSSPDLSEKQLEELKNHKVANPVKEVTCKEEKTVKTENASKKVVLWDFGAKESLVRCMTDRGVEVVRVPADTTAARIKEIAPDGILLSGGPGNPSDNENIIEEIKKVCELKLPTFAICLGHILLAMSQGAKATKLKYGHRGANQPSKYLKTGRVYITSQNQGYAVDKDNLPKNSEMSFVNVNDGICEGLKYKDIPAFSVQFEPEAKTLESGTGFLFDEFADMMEGGAE